jgi:hypothetical protein
MHLFFLLNKKQNQLKFNMPQNINHSTKKGKNEVEFSAFY